LSSFTFVGFFSFPPPRGRFANTPPSSSSTLFLFARKPLFRFFPWPSFLPPLLSPAKWIFHHSSGHTRDLFFFPASAPPLLPIVIPFRLTARLTWKSTAFPGYDPYSLSVPPLSYSACNLFPPFKTCSKALFCLQSDPGFLWGLFRTFPFFSFLAPFLFLSPLIPLGGLSFSIASGIGVLF